MAIGLNQLSKDLFGCSTSHRKHPIKPIVKISEFPSFIRDAAKIGYAMFISKAPVIEENIWHTRKGVKLKASVYRPAKEGKFPLIAFDAGLRTGVNNLKLLTQGLVRLGFVVAGTESIEEVTKEEGLDYINMINKLRSLSHLNIGNTGLIGISSGGGAMSIVAANKKAVTDNNICAVALLSTYANLGDTDPKTDDMYTYAIKAVNDPKVSSYAKEILRAYLEWGKELGKTPENSPQVYRDASPMTHIPAIAKNKEKFRVLIGHGISDQVLLYTQAVQLYGQMIKAGIKVQLKLVPGDGIHVDFNNADSLLSSLAGLIATATFTYQFLKKNLEI